MKKHLKLLISLLQSIEKNTGQVAKSYEDNYIVDVLGTKPNVIIVQLMVVLHMDMCI